MDEAPPEPDRCLNVAEASSLCSAAMQITGEPAADVAVEPPEPSADVAVEEVEARGLAAPSNGDFAPKKENKVSPKKRARPRSSVGGRKTKTQAGRKASRLSDLVRRAAEESDEAAEKEVAPPRSHQVTRSIEGAEATIYFPRGLPKPPRQLLPEDAQIKQMPAPPAPKSAAVVHEGTVAAARADGLAAQELWEGLGEVPEGLEKGFRSLLILGPSGSGKSTLLRSILRKYYPDFNGPLYPSTEWSHGFAIIEAFEGADRGRSLLSGVGLSSIPSWCKPYNVLSTGEKYRANLARALEHRGPTPLVFDEWTSELDRSLAKVVSTALGKRMSREWEKAAETKAQHEKLELKEEIAEEEVCGTDADADEENNEEAPKDEDAEEKGTEEVEAEKDSAKDCGLANSEGEAEEGVRDEVDETLEENTAAPTPAEKRPPHHFLKLLQRSYCIQADEVARKHGKGKSLTKGEHVEEKAEQSEEAIQKEAVSEHVVEKAEQSEEAVQKEVAESVQREDEDAAPKPESNPQEEPRGREAPTTFGPYIFASCHEDVLQYLQPQFVCYCAVGQKPKLLANPHAGRAPRIEGVMEGDPMPVYHDLIGTWKPQVQKKEGCCITYKGCLQEDGTMKLRFNGGKEVKWLRRNGDVYTGGIAPKLQKEIRGIDPKLQNEILLRSLSTNLLTIQFRDHPSEAWSKEVRYSRVVLPFPDQANAMAKDPEKAVRSGGLHYADCDRKAMEQHGWYLPPEWAGDGLYQGLQRQGDPEVVRAVNFRHDPKVEPKEDKQRYLATYVGEPDGSLSEKLANVSQLLDWPFDGLCAHRLDPLPVPKDFRLGVITGPSGSGKSSLAADVFGASPVISWSPAEPVIAHFESLECAYEFLEAAHLHPSIAMRPFSTLSGGEQARANMARVLDLGCQKNGRFKALILEEFTSLVDRATAQAMARGLQQLITRRTFPKIVVVSCHTDFVQKSGLEPDWLFECHSHRLLRFGAPTDGAVEVPMEESDALKAARASVAAAEEQLAVLRGGLAEHAGQLCFSVTYRTEVAALAGALQVLGDAELSKKRKALSALEEEEASKKRMKKVEVEAERDDSSQVAPSTKRDVQPDVEVLSARSFQIPQLHLEVRRALPREWVHFRDHHYKDHTLQGAAVVFVGILDGRACGFCAVVQESQNWVQRNCAGGKYGATKAKWENVHYPLPWLKASRKLYREHRTVVLPDFQGLGVAPVLCDTVGNLCLRNGADFTSQTVHPFYGSYRDRSPFWRALPTSRQPESVINGNLKYSHAFLGAFQENGKQDASLVQHLRWRTRIAASASSPKKRKSGAHKAAVPLLT
ncbi:unnamed protein product [Symbiodinium sp. CCMP2592]|nr:unnamed protein product [Symbiodinium sp. CCMP2592]